MRLQIVTASTRPTRKGPAVARWVEEAARAHGRFEIEPVDLADVGLPLFDEPEHPRLRKYQHAHTRAWSAIVDRADAFVFVTPEYNYATPPPSLLNALDYLLHEWAYKPAGLVSYGGASGGMRGVLMTRQVLLTLKVVPLVEAVAIPAFTKQIDPAGVFTPEPHQIRAAGLMLDELHRWAGALQGLRQPPRTVP